jgi:hypothetical protein
MPIFLQIYQIYVYIDISRFKGLNQNLKGQASSLPSLKASNAKHIEVQITLKITFLQCFDMKFCILHAVMELRAVCLSTSLISALLITTVITPFLLVLHAWLQELVLV